MPYAFIVESGPRAGLHLPLKSHTPVVLGRGTDVDVHLPEEDRYVSRHHARVEVHPDGVYLHDLAERMSTSVNGMNVRWARLAPGNVVRLGNTLLRLVQDGDETLPNEGPDDVSVYVVVDSSRYFEGIQGPLSSPLRRPSAGRTVDVGWPQDAAESAADALVCDACGVTGQPPPSPDLWDAAWLCSNCTNNRRQFEPDLPTRIGRFDILGVLQRGGLGLLLDAVSIDHGIHAVVKMLPTAHVTKKTVDRFLREQRIATALRHPNIVRCYEVGSHEGRPFIVSEYVPGGTAEQCCAVEQPVQDMLWLGADLFRALGYAHDLGIVHRDVSPANVLLTGKTVTSEVRAKLADFGLAKSKLDLQSAAITMAGEAGGSTLTMSPEQIHNFIQVTPSTDIYAAAATVFWLLTNDTPLVLPCRFDDAPVHIRTEAIVKKERRSLGDVRPDLPKQVVGLLDGLLTFDGSTRASASAKKIAAELSELAERVAQVPSTKKRVSQVQAPKPPAAREASPDRFALAISTLEHFVNLLDKHVETAAADVRAAVKADDPDRVERAAARHECLRHDLEIALARWEELVSLSR